MLHRPGRYRYIYFVVSSEKKAVITKNEVLNALRQKSKQNGAISWREAKWYLIRYNHPQGIFRCKHGFVSDAKLLLQSVRSINSIPVSVRTKQTSGTIKTLSTHFSSE